MDILPHPDMFAFADNEDGAGPEVEEDGAKRAFFGGERFVDTISGVAQVRTVKTILQSSLFVSL